VLNVFPDDDGAGVVTTGGTGVAVGVVTVGVVTVGVAVGVVLDVQPATATIPKTSNATTTKIIPFFPILIFYASLDFGKVASEQKGDESSMAKGI